MRKSLKLLLPIALLLSPALADLYPKTGIVEVQVSGVTSNQGTVRGYVFANRDSWLKNERAVAVATTAAKAGEVELRFDKVPLGERYAISVYQDENDNGKLDTRSVLPIPTEPVGASNYQGGSMPRYFECSFYFKTSPTKLSLELRKI